MDPSPHDMDETRLPGAEELASARRRIADLEEAALRHDQDTRDLARLASFPEQNPNLVLEAKLSGEITYLNPVARARFPELAEQGFQHPLLADIETILRVIQDGAEDYFAREIDLGESVYEQKICLVAGGQLIRVFAHDITARKRAEEAVRELAEERRRLAQQVIMAQEEERQRISRELHDEAGQALAALKIRLALLQHDLPDDRIVLWQALAEAISMSDSTRNQIRLLAQGLRPPELDVMGLQPTLEGFCQSFANRTKLKIRYEGTDPPPLADAVQICLYRVLQEALANVAEHARASEVLVRLATEESWISLTVADNGKGLPEESPEAALGRLGLGLPGMRERLELLDGELQVSSRPGKGTQLVARIPLEGVG